MEMDKDQKLDDLFSQAQNDTPQVSFDEMQDSFLTHVENPSMEDSATETSNLFTIKTWTIMITTILTTGIAIGYLTGFFNTDEVLVENRKMPVTTMPIELTTNQLTALELDESELEIPVVENDLVYYSDLSQNQRIENVTEPKKLNPADLNEEPALFIDTQQVKEDYRFPVLTAEEKKLYAKHKTKMVKQLIKRDKKMYAYIPSGTMNYEFAEITVRPFHMQNSEVTNFQYRTFLFDLLEQGRKEDFLMAKPDQSLWAKDFPEYNQPMVDLYFSHPAYNQYPVNNISRKGAELYCEWLTSEANKVQQSKKKPEINDVRLPTIFEWVYAARGGMKESPYPWGGPYNRNAKGCYLANFNPEGESPDEDGVMLTANVYSYSPNDYGLYCMSGNVAEMVYYIGGKSEPGTKGGSFLSKAENIQIDGKDEFKGITSPNVNIGFRVVISYGIVEIPQIKDMN